MTESDVSRGERRKKTEERKKTKANFCSFLFLFFFSFFVTENLVLFHEPLRRSNGSAGRSLKDLTSKGMLLMKPKGSAHEQF